MGFLDHSTNNIILDAVLTDMGRKLLAEAGGNFQISKFALADDEVDYRIIKEFGRTVGKEKIEKNTPVLEANTTGYLGLKYRLRSLNNNSLSTLPLLKVTSGLTSDIVSLARSNSTTTGLSTSQSVTIEQSIASGRQNDPDAADFSFRVILDSLFFQIVGHVPDSIDSRNVAVYTIPANSSISSQNTTSCTFTIFSKPVGPDVFSSYRLSGQSVVQKNCEVTGLNSGANVHFTVQTQ